MVEISGGNTKRLNYLRFPVIAVVLASFMVWGIEQIVVARDLKRFQEQVNRLANFLADGRKETLVMGSMTTIGMLNPVVKGTALGTLPPDNPQVKSLLAHADHMFGLSDIFVLNHDGVIVSYFNDSGKSGTGRNVSFRPYYRAAISGTANMYPALGTNTGERGIYIATPIREAETGATETSKENSATQLPAPPSAILGVMVAKIGFEEIDQMLAHEAESFAVVSPEGIVFSSNVDSWQFKVLGSQSDFELAKKDTRVKTAFEKQSPQRLELNDKGLLEMDGSMLRMTSASIDWKDPQGSWRLVGFSDPLKSFGNVQRLFVGTICLAFIILLKAWWQAKQLAKLRTEQVHESNRELKIAMGELDQRNQFIKKTFGRYMSEEVVEKLLESPDGLRLGGELLTVTIVMTDLRGFSALSEILSPEEVVTMLNSYLSDMTDIIFKYSGTIIEIIGDAIMILFGAPTMRPDDADRALACALEMQIAMEKINQRNRENKQPELEMGIGVNTGNVVAGNIGSDMRVKYAVVGSNVNLTGRVESYTVGGQVLITESTLNALSLKPVIGGEMAVPFKGLEKPVNIYDVTGVSGTYEITLPQPEIVFVPLADEIPLSFEILDGKHSSGEFVPGRIIKLAEKYAIFSSEVELAKLANLKVILSNFGGGGAESTIYSKVMKASPDADNCYEMRFTSIPKGIIKLFDDAMKKPQN